MGELEININLLTIPGFFDRFNELCGEYPNATWKEVFEMVNSEHETMFDRPKYTDYNSFRVTKSRYYKSLERKSNNLKQNVNNVNAN